MVRVPVRYPEADASVSRKTKIKLIQKKIEENTFVTSFFLKVDRDVIFTSSSLYAGKQLTVCMAEVATSTARIRGKKRSISGHDTLFQVSG